MSFQLWDLLQDTPLCEGAGPGRDRQRDALSNLHPPPACSSKEKNRIFSQEDIQDLWALLVLAGTSGS